MKLTRLTLDGFKSFADKAVFNLDQGFTALVGPNGSGKSNVVDAIRWVLGEQSARSLRGTEMADVIFDGSEARQAKNSAEVQLHIDNSDRELDVDQDEVSIRRRVYRSGEGEYYINNERCRLKDIQSMLMDTGLGVGCYNVIQQGEIDRLLQAGADERREILEEAAGINTYLMKKKEAERKLERVSSNLDRAADILEEVQNRLRSVKAQATKARRYKQYQHRFEKLWLARALHRHRDLRSSREEGKKKLEKLQEEIGELDNRREKQESQISETRRSLQKVADEVSSAQERLTHIQARTGNLEGEVEMNRERVSEMDQQRTRLKQRRREVEEKASSLEDELQEAREDLEACREKLENKKKLVQEKKQTLQREKKQCRELESRIEDRKEDAFEVMQEKTQAQNQISVLQSEKRTLKNRRRRLQDKEDGLEDSIEQAREKREHCRKKSERLESELEDVAEDISALDGRIDDTSSELDDVESKKSEVKAELSARESRKKLLEDLQERREGVDQGAKNLLQAAEEGHLEGCRGMVADLITADVEHAPAVDAALGDHAQVVVFDTPSQARRALNFLKEEEAGRARVLALDHLSGNGCREHEPDGMRRIADLVESEDGAEKAAKTLLGDSMLVDGQDEAHRRLNDGLPAGLTLVTPDGDRLEVGGTWMGGTGRDGGLVSRRSELADIKEELPGLRQRREELKGRIESLQKQLEDLEDERDELTDRRENLNRRANDARNDLRMLENRLEGLEEDLEVNRSEQQEVKEELQRVGRREENLEEKKEELQERAAGIQSDVDEMEAELSEKQEDMEQISSAVAEAENEKTRLEEQASNLSSLADRVQKDIESARRERKQVEEQLEECDERQEKAQEAIEEAQQEIEKLQNEKEELQDTLQSRRERKSDLETEIERLENREDELSEEREELQERLQERRVKLNEVKIKIENLAERSREEQGVNLTALEMEPEQWRENPLFCDREIAEFAEDEDESGAEKVARWYLEEEEDGGDGDGENDSGRVSLQEARDLRESVLEVADDDSTDWDEVDEEIQELNTKMSRLGSVNMDAIREQDQLEMREQFLSDQVEDLEEARRHEQRIIRELNRKSREQFRQTFEEVRENFRELFRKLFRGGSADLILDTEPEEEGEEEIDILDAGVDIKARPPGKEAQSITLLSGGEKALTTVALLFSIFRARPSPFCLLDEVDATLDESNLERFIGMLQEFLDSTQFILITHNKLTMSVADTLYGISLKEDGVSQKISVHFEEVENRLEEMSGEEEAARRTA